MHSGFVVGTDYNQAAYPVAELNLPSRNLTIICIALCPQAMNEAVCATHSYQKTKSAALLETNIYILRFLYLESRY